jgi:drug/metabolite transporter (DMT)-like permease
MTVMVLFGIGSGLCWGVADFFGGLQARRLPALAVAFWSQIAGALALLVVLLARGDAPVSASLAWGAGAGVFGALGLVLFYRALAIGVMSLVAPVAACGALVPVVISLLRGEPLGLLPALGIAVALAGVVLVSVPTETVTPGHAAPRPALLLALGAALTFGFFFACLDGGAGENATTALWTVAGARLSSLPTLGVLIAATVRRVPWPGQNLAPIAAVGVLDTVANALFAYAATSGNAGVVAVLGSLYPVATVLLGRVILQERLTWLQGSGVVVALSGVVLLSLR